MKRSWIPNNRSFLLLLLLLLSSLPRNIKAQASCSNELVCCGPNNSGCELGSTDNKIVSQCDCLNSPFINDIECSSLKDCCDAEVEVCCRYNSAPLDDDFNMLTGDIDQGLIIVECVQPPASSPTQFTEGGGGTTLELLNECECVQKNNFCRAQRFLCPTEAPTESTVPSLVPSRVPSSLPSESSSPSAAPSLSTFPSSFPTVQPSCVVCDDINPVGLSLADITSLKDQLMNAGKAFVNGYNAALDGIDCPAPDSMDPHQVITDCDTAKQDQREAVAAFDDALDDAIMKFEALECAQENSGIDIEPTCIFGGRKGAEDELQRVLGEFRSFDGNPNLHGRSLASNGRCLDANMPCNIENEDRVQEDLSTRTRGVLVAKNALTALRRVPVPECGGFWSGDVCFTFATGWKLAAVVLDVAAQILVSELEIDLELRKGANGGIQFDYVTANHNNILVANNKIDYGNEELHKVMATVDRVDGSVGVDEDGVTVHTKLDGIDESLGEDDENGVTVHTKLDDIDESLGEDEDGVTTVHDKLDDIDASLGEDEDGVTTAHTKLDDIKASLGEDEDGVTTAHKKLDKLLCPYGEEGPIPVFPGQGCDGIDHDCDCEVDECDEDQLKPTIELKVPIPDIPFERLEDAEAFLDENVVVGDDCATDLDRTISGPAEGYGCMETCTFTVRVEDRRCIGEVPEASRERKTIEVLESAFNERVFVLAVEPPDSTPPDITCGFYTPQDAWHLAEGVDFDPCDGVAPPYPTGDDDILHIDAADFDDDMVDVAFWYQVDNGDEAIDVTIEILSNELADNRLQNTQAFLIRRKDRPGVVHRADVFLAPFSCQDYDYKSFCRIDPEEGVTTRIYDIVLSAVDASGNAASKTCSVIVVPCGHYCSPSIAGKGKGKGKGTSADGGGRRKLNRNPIRGQQVTPANSINGNLPRGNGRQMEEEKCHGGLDDNVDLRMEYKLSTQRYVIDSLVVQWDPELDTTPIIDPPIPEFDLCQFPTSGEGKGSSRHEKRVRSCIGERPNLCGECPIPVGTGKGKGGEMGAVGGLNQGTREFQVHQLEKMNFIYGGKTTEEERPTAEPTAVPVS